MEISLWYGSLVYLSLDHTLQSLCRPSSSSDSFKDRPPRCPQSSMLSHEPALQQHMCAAGPLIFTIIREITCMGRAEPATGTLMWCGFLDMEDGRWQSGGMALGGECCGRGDAHALRACAEAVARDTSRHTLHGDALCCPRVLKASELAITWFPLPQSSPSGSQHSSG